MAATKPFIIVGKGSVPISYHSFRLVDMPPHGAPCPAPGSYILFFNGLIHIQPGIAVITTDIASGDHHPDR
ncbi:hypothetical protein ACSNOI_24030 [Actinomadura kijaniata]|uniref:hypothetical protein n=1 Tax=Actinomadura kijaniata TaxID=46161 RepID=UPI003F1A9A2C